MRVLLSGGRGQLATDLAATLRDAGHHVTALGREDWDVTDPAASTAVLDRENPDVVVNTAAYHRVDEVEDHPARAFAVNAEAVLRLARATRARGARLVHLSTDYVFDGQAGRPLTEEDLPRPLNVYGASKLAGEHLALQADPNALVLRTSGLFGLAGASGKGGNFIESMLRLAGEKRAIRVVNDQVLSPTYTPHLSRLITNLLESGAPGGLYHATAEGWTSFYDFAASIFHHAGLAPALSPQTSAESGARAHRPGFSALISPKRAALGLPPVPHWREGLAEYLGARRARAERLAGSMAG